MTDVRRSETSQEWLEAVNALARDIAERATGMPAYLVDDETWAAALDEAQAIYKPPESKSPLRRAIDDLRRPDPVAFINAYNEARRRNRG